MTFLQIFTDQAQYFAGLRVAVLCQLRKEQLLIDHHLKPPTVRRNQGDRLNLRLKMLQQFGRQTGSPFCVMSDRAVCN
jgi:hypothetical protein